MKLSLLLFALFISAIFAPSEEKDFRIHKWVILDWKKSYYIDIPKLNYTGWTFLNEASKSININYLDASVISVLVDPPALDSTNKKYSLADLVIIQEKLSCSKDINTSDTIRKGDTIIFHGQLNNGRLWKEKWFKRGKICYINVRKEQSGIYDRSIGTFREKR